MFLFNDIEVCEQNKPYYLINGVLTKNHPFNRLWESYLPFFKGVECGIDRPSFDRIVEVERLDSVKSYGYARKIVFSESDMKGYSWIIAIFPCEVIVNGVPKKLFTVTGTGERGSEGDRAYFEEEKYALAYLIARLRRLKKKAQNVNDSTYEIEYEDGCLQLSSKYKYLCSLQKDNPGISRVVNYKLRRKYEDTYHVNLDSESGVLVLSHQVLSARGAGYTSDVKHANVIHFDDLKMLLLYEVDYLKALVKKWEGANDLDRAASCKEQITILEKILLTYPVDWKDLLNI